MNIIFGTPEEIQQLESKYTALELDTFLLPGSDQPVTSWCILENISFQDMLSLDKLISIHSDLMKNYRLRNWNYCEQAIEHLSTQWNGQLNSFYSDLLMRISVLKTQDLGEDWSPIISKK